MQTVPPALDLDLLRTFAVFAAQLNFTRAAAQLHRSQPAVHARVGRLAEALGVALYRREGRGLALTPGGRRVAAFARETGERAEAFLAALRGDEAPRPVCLCAGADPTALRAAGLRVYRSPNGVLLARRVPAACVTDVAVATARARDDEARLRGLFGLAATA